MHAVILAAGRGSRLGDLDYPKALAPLNQGETILARQVRLLKENIPKPLLIHIVVGYKKELVMEKFRDLYFVINLIWHMENTGKSLWKAFDTFIGDVIFMNGDVVFHPSALQEILQFNKTSMLVNKAPVGEEEVKYKLNKEGAISAVSKDLKDAEGEALGINLFKKEDMIKLKAALEDCGYQDYFEKGIETCIKQGMKILPVTIDADLCVEVDFPEDLQKASRLQTEWGI